MESRKESFFGTRLKYARKMAGFSLQNLSDKLGNLVTKQALSKYEQGIMLPTNDVLMALSDILNLKPDYFLKKEDIGMENISFRKKSDFSMTDEEKVVEKARYYVERFLEIENILGIQHSFINPIEGISIFNLNDAENAANKLRNDWNLGQNPIPNIIEMLELKGVKVSLIDENDKLDGFSFFAANGLPVVVINSRNKSIERLRFTVIHELAHLILNISEKVCNDSKEVEKICHRFSSCFLLPGEMLINMIGGLKRNYIEIQELIKIKEYYGISIRATIHRLREMHVIAPVYYQKWMVYLSKTFGGKDEPGKYKGDEQPKEMAVYANRAISEGLISLSKAAVILDTDINDLRKGLANVR